MKVRCEIEEIELEGDYSDSVPGLQATCSRCDHATESFGITVASAKRCLALMREQCPMDENNFYCGDEDAAR